MLKQIIIPIVGLILALLTVSEGSAGIVVNSDGVITNAELTIPIGAATGNPGTYNVSFIEGSYQEIGTGLINFTPWWDASPQGDTARALNEILVNHIRNYVPLSTLDTGAIYLFAYGERDYLTIYAAETINEYDVWNTDDDYYDMGQATNIVGSDVQYLHYATFNGPGDSAVPEPSTAIAMGLLGIVGFAGNRRRRRQVSVA
ncbi:PEP-CTERM motif protein [Stieleria bergensis]|uniref:PEP-CTERM motif protein n=1 Tax=Stieleria bergensis TaxID=2528025 RepID=A0A517T241_9BACT|nr:PEP-CTERM motif protein [Planctomycetes bacterium SV_7m_r]